MKHANTDCQWTYCTEVREHGLLWCHAHASLIPGKLLSEFRFRSAKMLEYAGGPKERFEKAERLFYAVREEAITAIQEAVEAHRNL